MTEATEEFFEHFGVKGMHWGVRKTQSTSGSSQKTASKPIPVPVLTKTFKSGDSVSIYRNPTPFLAKQIAKFSPAAAKRNENNASFTLKDATGHKVGEAGFMRTSKNELNLDWIGVRSQYRGKGYASAALQGVVKYAQNEGIKKLTLEVPGESPDARHIYEKLGFKPDSSRQKELDDVGDAFWGGLTAMSLDVPQLKHAADDETAWEKQYADEFAQMLIENFDSEGAIVTHNQDTDDFLAHYGVLGMKWGRRKSRSSVELVDSKTGKKVSVSYNPKNVSLSDSRGKVKISTSNVREATKIQKQIDKSVGTNGTPVHKITGKASETHPDSAEAKSARLKASVNGLDSLSNKEVQAVVTRMNLEQQYLKLNQDSVSSGKQFLADTARDTLKSEIKGGVKKAASAGVKAGVKAATSR